MRSRLRQNQCLAWFRLCRCLPIHLKKSKYIAAGTPTYLRFYVLFGNCRVSNFNLARHTSRFFQFNNKAARIPGRIFRTVEPNIFCASLTYLLTYSIVKSPSWEANWFAASQEIPRILWNPKVHYRTHKPPPPVSILDQPNKVHIPTSHLLEIHANIIQPIYA